MQHPIIFAQRFKNNSDTYKAVCVNYAVATQEHNPTSKRALQKNHNGHKHHVPVKRERKRECV